MNLYDLLNDDEKKKHHELQGDDFKIFRSEMSEKYGGAMQKALQKLPPELLNLIKETAFYGFRVSDMLMECGDAFCNDANNLQWKANRLQDIIKGEI